MILNQLRPVQTSDVRHFSWTGLSRFKNTRYTAEKIFEYQNPPGSQRSNVIKQAEQVRYCIVQAEEYFSAAKHVTLATKPLLIYYGIMSLALAEILVKQSGDSSLDRSRARHNHHGLTLSITGNPSKEPRLEDSASLLRAIPHIREGGGRYGTFELWHRSSRESSFSGNSVVHYPNGIRTERIDIVGYGDDVRPELVPIKGISLLDCLKSMPSMIGIINSLGIDTNLLSARVSLDDIPHQEKIVYCTYVNPAKPEILSKGLERFKYEPSLVDCVDVDDSGGGCIVRISYPYAIGPKMYKAPSCFQIKSGNVFFSSEEESLNEFGLMYFFSYIMGNYARYYPDFWMKDVDEASSLSMIVSEFLLNCEERAPLLALSELSQTLHVLDD